MGPMCWKGFAIINAVGQTTSKSPNQVGCRPRKMKERAKVYTPWVDRDMEALQTGVAKRIVNMAEEAKRPFDRKR